MLVSNGQQIDETQRLSGGPAFRMAAKSRGRRPARLAQTNPFPSSSCGLTNHAKEPTFAAVC
jgi:hypothetical protein